MARTDSNDSFDDYMKKIERVKLTPLSRQNLTPLTDEEAKVNQTNINKLIAEGNRLLAEEAKNPRKKFLLKKDESKRLESKLASTSTNPYVRARVDTLNKMKADEKETIRKMEENEIERDRRYDEFVKAVRILGDQYSA